MMESYRLHKDTLQNYLAFSATIIGATIAAALKAFDGVNDFEWFRIIILIGPIVNFFIGNYTRLITI